MSNKVTKYDLAQRLVQREVIYCVSALMGDLRNAIGEGCHALQEYEEDINNLMETTDYEAPGQQHIDQADAGELQEAVELFDGDWDVVLVENGFPTQDMLDEAISSFNQDISDLEGEEELSPEDAEKLARLQAERNALPEDLDEWCAAEEGRLDKLRQVVTSFVEDEGDWKTLCEENRIDPDRDEVYEHWIVTDWLAACLEENGHTTGEVCGMTIWGRGCTGQAIALDHVIQKIACGLWGDELTDSDPADAF